MIKRTAQLTLLFLLTAVASSALAQVRRHDVFMPVAAHRTIAPDAYEVDNRAASARPIELDETQVRTLAHGDTDWARFVIDGTYNVIETRGPSPADTTVTVYDASMTVVATDAPGYGDYSRIELYDSLPPGVYYAQITATAPVAVYWLNYRNYDDYLDGPPLCHYCD